MAPIKPALVANHADNQHCCQACIRMVLQHAPNEAMRDLSFDDIDARVNAQPGFDSWEFSFLPLLQEAGFTHRLIWNFDTKAFLKDSKAYLLKKYGAESGAHLIKMTHFDSIVPVVRANGHLHEARVPQLFEIASALDDGWYAICVVNSKKLNGKPGYTGHMVLLYDHDVRNVHILDPGLEAQDRKATWTKFNEAWSDPSDDVRILWLVKAG